MNMLRVWKLKLLGSLKESLVWERQRFVAMERAVDGNGRGCKLMQRNASDRRHQAQQT